MKYLLVALIGHFVTLGLAQSNELNQANKLINSFKTDEKIEHLEKADDLISDLFAKKDFLPTAKALFTKANVMSLLLQNEEQDDPISYSQELHQLYSDALKEDENMNLRYDILNELYMSKVKMMDLGNKAYEAEDYGVAHTHYQNALKLNALEISYPKHAKLDTSVLFSGAVFAKLGNKNKEAIADLERLADLNYQRKEIYDYLIELYTKEGEEKKLERIIKIKAERFPE